MPTEPIQRYLHDIESLSTESARSTRFAQLLQELFSAEPRFIEEYAHGVEQVVRTRYKDRLLRGQVDNLFGNLIIEFEADLERKRTEAETQLAKYVQILWAEESDERKTPYLCLATDGVRFALYTPVASAPAPTDEPPAVTLHPIECLDWRTLAPESIYLWLDRILLRRERLKPTSELIVREFGLRSHAYRVVHQRLLAFWNRHCHLPQYAVLYEGWAKYLSIVYGALPQDPELFLRHIYLATLAKLMAWQRLGARPLQPSDIPDLLNGKLFQQQGVHGYIEDDFFAWLARPEAQPLGVEIVTRLNQMLHAYDLSQLNEDVLKSLYQELVDPDTRHDLGEYYTPDWLAHRMVQTLLEPDPRRTMLDPACGSGTFLYFAIVEKRARLGDSPDTLRHILQSVCGADIHPLAVLIARTNYLLALGDLLHQREDALHLPVYLADTLRLPEHETLPIAGQPTLRYRLELDGAELFLPESFLSDPTLYDRLIELAREAAETHAHRELSRDALRNLLQARELFWTELSEEFEAFATLVRLLKERIEAGRDTIWAFVLKNLYRPLFLRQRFDALMGNPPWIAFRFLEAQYQAFLRRLIVSNYKLVSARGELITHLEIATLFWVRAADLYLKTGGVVGFVMPRSLFNTDQHDALRRAQYRLSERPHASLQITALWDCEDVAPLFSVPCCVLWGQLVDDGEPKRDGTPAIEGQIIAGKLPRKNASLQEADESLTVQPTQFYLHQRGKRSYWSATPPTHADAPQANPYRDRFRQGATLVPRTFWFVQLQSTPLGYNPQLPLVKTYAPSKSGPVDRYKHLSYKDTVEAKFLYATLLGDDVLPFCYRNTRVVLLPIIPTEKGYELLNAEIAFKQGYIRLAQWLKRAESEWNRLRGSKSHRYSLTGWIDHRRNLSQQSPTARYRVLYPDVNRIMTACVVDLRTLFVQSQDMLMQGYITDCKNYVCETDDEGEAFYLCSLLNAPIIDERLTPLRRRDQKGHPDVHKKIFDVAAFPLYDANDEKHRELAELGRACAQKVSEALDSGELDRNLKIGLLRRRTRELLAEELKKIDHLARELVK